MGRVAARPVSIIDKRTPAASGVDLRIAGRRA
jgi:hypothetical protein